MTTGIESVRTYFGVYACLIACTYLTWQVAYFDLGALNLVATLAIAALKMLLIVLFFMHARSSARLTWMVALGSLFWLAILLSLTLADYSSRSRSF